MNNCVIFRDLTDKEIDLVKKELKGWIGKYSKNETIIRENAIVKEIGIILKGNACISKYTIGGKEILMQKLLVGYLVGGEIAFTRQQDSPYIVYSSDDTEIYWIDADKILEKGIINDDIRLVMLKNIMYFIANENIRKYYKIEAISMKSVRERIVQYLSLQKKLKLSDSFFIKFDREELANFLGINRSVLSNELTLMEKEGMIEFKKNYFKILKL